MARELVRSAQARGTALTGPDTPTTPIRHLTHDRKLHHVKVGDPLRAPQERCHHGTSSGLVAFPSEQPGFLRVAS